MNEKIIGYGLCACGAKYCRRYVRKERRVQIPVNGSSEEVSEITVEPDLVRVEAIPKGASPEKIYICPSCEGIKLIVEGVSVEGCEKKDGSVLSCESCQLVGAACTMNQEIGLSAAGIAQSQRPAWLHEEKTASTA